MRPQPYTASSLSAGPASGRSPAHMSTAPVQPSPTSASASAPAWGVPGPGSHSASLLLLGVLTGGSMGQQVLPPRAAESAVALTRLGTRGMRGFSVSKPSGTG